MPRGKMPEAAAKADPLAAVDARVALEFARAVYAFGGGQPVRRLSVFDELQKSSETGASRQLVINPKNWVLLRAVCRLST